MNTFYEIFTQFANIEYENEYDLSLKKSFSIPKIYSAKGDSKKRWYVYYSFRDPLSGKLKRQSPIYGNANNYKTKEDRLSVLVAYRKTLLKFLKQGYNPYKDNNSLFKELTKNQSKHGNPIEHNLIAEKANLAMPYSEALDFGLDLKKKVVNPTTFRSYANRIKTFKKWIGEFHPDIKTIDEINKKIITEFLNTVLSKTSPRNRNNFRTELATVMQVLYDNDIIDTNIIKQIPVLKSTPKRNKTYTKEKQEDIFKYLEDKDASLLLFIKFISYNFLRPIEVCRIKIGDIDLKNKTIQFKAKNSPLKTKIIPDLLINELPDLSKMNKEHFLFTPDKIGGEWHTALANKRDYYSKRFKRVVKDHFDMGKEYGLYSFRHTYITKLYRHLVKTSSPFEAKSRLMLITGHSSMSALQKYLRDIDAELPEDYSHMLKS